MMKKEKLYQDLDRIQTETDDDWLRHVFLYDTHAEKLTTEQFRNWQKTLQNNPLPTPLHPEHNPYSDLLTDSFQEHFYNPLTKNFLSTLPYLFYVMQNLLPKPEFLEVVCEYATYDTEFEQILNNRIQIYQSMK